MGVDKTYLEVFHTFEGEGKTCLAPLQCVLVADKTLVPHTLEEVDRICLDLIHTVGVVVSRTCLEVLHKK